MDPLDTGKKREKEKTGSSPEPELDESGKRHRPEIQTSFPLSMSQGANTDVLQSMIIARLTHSPVIEPRCYKMMTFCSKLVFDSPTQSESERFVLFSVRGGHVSHLKLREARTCHEKNVYET